MSTEKVVVIGAGPAGLTAAYELSKNNIDTIVFEQENFVGGLSRTVEHQGYRFDIGGHRFFTKVQWINSIWHEVLGEDFLECNRLSRIYYQQKFFNYPIQPLNAFFGLGPFNSVLIFSSYVYSQIFPEQPEENFEQWVSNRFGKRLYKTFFQTYTEKVWGMSCKEIRAEWAAQRIKGLSLLSAVKNAFFGNKKVIKTLIDSFHYPKLGPGMMWEKMAELIENHGNQVLLNSPVKKIYWENNRIIEIESQDNKKYKADHLISSLPIRHLIHQMDPAPPRDVLDASSMLHYRDFIVITLIVNKQHIFPDNWIYIHDPSVKLGRIQNFKNWSQWMVPDNTKTCLGLEYFCFEGDGMWSASDEDLLTMAKRELQQIGLVDTDDIEKGIVIRVPKAYPVYDQHYKEALETILQFLKPIENLQLVGRNGMHKYNNQDHSMLTALLAARNILGENHDLWSVNEEQQYHEEVDKNEAKPFQEISLTQPQVPIQK